MQHHAFQLHLGPLRRPAAALRPWPSTLWGSQRHVVEHLAGCSAATSSGEDTQLGTGRTLRMARLEAILLLAREPLTTRKLSQFANLADGTEARTLIRQLNQWYDTHGCAFRVEQTAGGYRLLTRPKFANWVRRLSHTPEEVRLSSVALETLALVAYRQPILRADIEAIRGVSCGEILRQLMDRDLVRICGRSEELGRPYLYGTTKPFLLLFGLKDLDELPRAEQLRGEGLPAPVPLEQAAAANSQESFSESPQTGHQQEENHVTVTATLATATEDELSLLPGGIAAPQAPQAAYDDDEDDLGDDDLDDDEDYDDDYGDDDDLDDEDLDDEDLDDEDDEDDEDDDDFDDWEEVDDDEEEEDDDLDDEWDDDEEEEPDLDDDDDWEDEDSDDWEDEDDD